MMEDEESTEELETIRQKKLAQMRRSLTQEEQNAQLKQQLEEKKQAALKMILSPEARARLANLKMVKPDFAEQLELQLLQLSQTGKLGIPITDSQLKQLLLRLQSQKKNIKIRRI